MAHAGRPFFRHKVGVMTVISFAPESRQTRFAMMLAEQGKNVCFIDHAKEQRHWLVCELFRLDARSEDYQSNQRAIRGSIMELDKAIWNAIQSQGDEELRQMAVIT
jgi:hypothetical protein